MEKKLIYLDTCSTTKPFEEVAKAVYEGMINFFGNPSSVHKLGVIAEKKLDEARIKISKTLEVGKEEIIFTSGASESNNFIINAFIFEGCNIITTEIEHPSVLMAYKRLEEKKVDVRYLKVDKSGRIDLKELEEKIDKNTVLISLSYVNNEIGTIEELEAVGNLIKNKSNRAKFHLDGAQSYGKLPVHLKLWRVDFFTTSAHKFNGPKGIGFAYLKKGLLPKPLIFGGGQEQNFRSGTENLPAILGMTVAAEINYFSMEDNIKKVSELKAYMMKRLREIDDVIFNCEGNEKFSPYILNVSFLGIRGEVLLHQLEEEDIYVSTGSACSSKKLKKKSILSYIGRTAKEAEGTIRFSFSKELTIEDLDFVIEKLKFSLGFLRRVKR